MDNIPLSVVFENLLELSPAGIFWKDADRRFLGANKMFLDYYGLKSLDELIGKTDEDMGWHIDPAPFRAEELRVIHNNEVSYKVPGQCIVKGKVRQIRATKHPLIMDGKTVGLIGYFEDVTEVVAERDRLAVLSQTDELTGLLNRRAYTEIVAQYEQQYYKEGTDFVLYMLDFDNFKNINDSYGHEYGNIILRAVSKALTQTASDNSVLFRYGGDEFVILHQYKDQEDIETLEKKLMKAVVIPRNIDGINIQVRASIGHSCFSESGYLSDMIEMADRRMYEMKAEHRKENK